MPGQLIRPPQPVLVPIPLRPQAARNISDTSWFGPLQPLRPIGENVQPRQWEYLPGQNLLYQPRVSEPIQFSDLIFMADNCDLVRIVIEALKDQLSLLPWQVRVKEIAGESQKQRGDRQKSNPSVQLWTDFFANPNPDQSWGDFLRMMCEDLLVLDATSILLQRTKAGKLGALRAIDGQTISRIIDMQGFTPAPPNPAYNQVLFGMPAVELTTEELIYRPRNQRARKLYGFSPVEQILLTLNIALRRMQFQLSEYTAGNVPEALYTMPGNVTEDNVRRFQSWFDQELAGNLQNRRRIWFIPGDDKGVNRLHFTKEALITDPADEWFARIVCFAFRISPKELIRIMNRATASESQDTAEEMGVRSVANFIADIMNTIIRKTGDTECEFAFAQKREADIEKQAKADQIYVNNGTRTRNEIREKLGDDPSDDPLAGMLGITTPIGFVPLAAAPQQGVQGPSPSSGAPAPSTEQQTAPSHTQS